MTFLMMLTTRLYDRVARVRAQGDSGQDLVEYSVLMAGVVAVGAVIYLIVSR